MACTCDLVSVIRVKANIPGDALMSANGTLRTTRHHSFKSALVLKRSSPERSALVFF